jgi:hypothetical protein
MPECDPEDPWDEIEEDAAEWEKDYLIKEDAAEWEKDSQERRAKLYSELRRLIPSASERKKLLQDKGLLPKDPPPPPSKHSELIETVIETAGKATIWTTALAIGIPLIAFILLFPSGQLALVILLPYILFLLFLVLTE